MRTPWDLETARAEFAARGFTLLSTRYRTTRDPLRYRCVCGREATLSLQALRIKPAGQHCRHCAADRRRLPHAEVAAAFRAAGCELLGKYCGVDEPVLIRCSCGRLGLVAFGAFRRGARCADCAAERRRKHA